MHSTLHGLPKTQIRTLVSNRAAVNTTQRCCEGCPSVSLVELLSRLRSSYLFSLLGYCSDNTRKLLVYEFMANGGLQEHLYPGSGVEYNAPLPFQYIVASFCSALHNHGCGSCLIKLWHQNTRYIVSVRAINHDQVILVDARAL